MTCFSLMNKINAALGYMNYHEFNVNFYPDLRSLLSFSEK